MDVPQPLNEDCWQEQCAVRHGLRHDDVMGTEEGPELSQYLTSRGRREVVATQLDEQLQRLLKVLRVDFQAHGGVVAGHILVDVIKRSPVQH